MIEILYYIFKKNIEIEYSFYFKQISNIDV